MIHVWIFESEAQEVLGASKQGHQWQGTLLLNSHQQVYSSYYFISTASVMIIINTGQGTPVESPGDGVFSWALEMKAFSEEKGDEVLRSGPVTKILISGRPQANACPEHLTKKQGMEPALYNVYKQSIALEITSHMMSLGPRPQQVYLGCSFPWVNVAPHEWRARIRATSASQLPAASSLEHHEKQERSSHLPFMKASSPCPPQILRYSRVSLLFLQCDILLFPISYATSSHEEQDRKLKSWSHRSRE